MQPQWIKDLKNGKTASTGNKPVTEQFTVLRRTSPAAHNPNVRPMIMSGSGDRMPDNNQGMSIPQPMSRLTGNGVDGQLQQNKMTGQVHEGEGVINANAMQNLSPDEFNAFSKALESGQLDKNSFRQAIGLQPTQGYAIGGLVKLPRLSQLDRGAAEDLAKATQPPSISAAPTIRTQTPAAPTPTIEAPKVQNQTPTPIAAPVVANLNPKTASPTVAPVQNLTMQNSPSQAPVQATPIVTAAPNPKAPSTTAAPTPTPISMNNAPAPNDRQTYYNDLFTNATGKDYRGTAAMAQENYDNSTMQRSGAANAAAAAAAAQELNQAGVSAAGKATQNAELARTQSASDDNLRSKLANQYTGNLSTFSNIDVQQRQQGMSEKQKAIDNFRYDTEAAKAQEQTDYNRKTNEEQTVYNRTQDALRNARLDKQDLTADQKAAQSSMEERLGMLFNGGSTLSAAQGDTKLQELVKSYLGPNATPEQISNEIATMFNSATTNNLDSFNGNAEKFIGAAIDNKKPIDQVLNDPNIRRNVAGYLGPNATAADIDKEISAIFNELNKSDSQRIFENFSENWVTDDIKEIPGWDTDLKETINDLYLKGVVDQDGNIKEGAVFEWPWEDPDTMFKYQDWNGNKVTSGSYDQAQTINLDGNGTKYINADGKAVTMQDANNKWSSISSVDRSGFMKDGKMDTAAFLAQYFPTTKDSSGNTVSLTTRADFTSKVTSDKTYLDKIDSVLTEFQSGGVVPGEPGKDPNAGDPISSSQFIYYDENGDPKVESKTAGNRLAYIYQQISDKYNKGNPLTAGQFQEYWQDGKPWRISSDGTVKNINNPGENIKTTSNEILNTVKLTDIQQPTAKLEKEQISSFKKLTEDEIKSNEMFANSNPGNGVQGYTGPYVLEESDGYDNRDRNMREDLEKWVNTNKGKLYRTKGGELFQIMGTSGGWTYMRDVESNEVYSTKQGTQRYNEGSATDSKWSGMFSNMNPEPQVVTVDSTTRLKNTNSR